MALVFFSDSFIWANGLPPPWQKISRTPMCSITTLLRHCFERLQHCFNIPMLCYVLREKLSLRIVSCSITLTKSKGLRDFSQWERQLCQYEFDTPIQVVQLSRLSFMLTIRRYSIVTTSQQRRITDGLWWKKSQGSGIWTEWKVCYKVWM